MRSLVLSVLAIGLSATAQEHRQREPTDTEARWIVLQTITTGESEEVAQHLVAHGFSAEAVEPMRQYVAIGSARIRDQGREMAAQLCARGSEFENNPEALAQEIEREDAAHDATVQDIIDHLPDILSDIDEAVFKAVVSHEGSHITVTDLDVPAGIRAGRITPAQANERACARGEHR